MFPDSLNKAIIPFASIHCDVWGPYHTPASCGAIYFLTIVDDYSRAVWTYLLLENSEVASLLRNFGAMANRQFGKKVTAHMINRTPTQVLDGKTPYEVLHGTPPIYDQLCVFGCLCYTHT